MDFRYNPEEHAFRMEVRKFIKEHAPKELIHYQGEIGPD